MKNTTQLSKLLSEWNKAGIKIKPQDTINLVLDTIHFKNANKAFAVFNYYAKIWNDNSEDEIIVNISHDNVKLDVNRKNELVMIDNKPRLVIDFGNGINKVERDIVDLVDDLYKPIEFTKYDMLLGNGIRLVANPLYE